jgi:DNA-binding GntR family transcriptional regulator
MRAQIEPYEGTLPRLLAQRRSALAADRACIAKAARSGPTAVALLSQCRARATLTERERLQLGPGAMVLRSVSVHPDRGWGCVYESITLALARFPGLGRAEVGAYDIVALAGRCGVRLARVRERLSIVPAGDEVASRLGIAPRTGLVRLDRAIFAASGEPLEWRVALHRLRDDDADADA